MPSNVTGRSAEAPEPIAGCKGEMVLRHVGGLFGCVSRLESFLSYDSSDMPSGGVGIVTRLAHGMPPSERMKNHEPRIQKKVGEAVDRARRGLGRSAVRSC